MAGATKPVSRKAKRKQEREDKKRQKNKRQRKESDKPVALKSFKAPSRGGKRPVQPTRGTVSGLTNKFNEFLAEAASAKNGKSNYSVLQ
jgi:hypothetical protein